LTNRATRGKLPSITSLKEQWAELEKEKRPLYSEYKRKKKEFNALYTAKSNSEKILRINKSREKSHGYGESL
jgi:hypothetical protein